MPNPLEPGLFSKEIGEAQNEWRSALHEVAPKVPFGPNYPKMLKEMQKDPRILDQVGKWREFVHISEEGMDQQTAKKKAAEDLTQFVRTFGGGE
jgi:hypothetical protein